MKKILVLHSAYRNLGGEDIAVSNEVKFLKKYYEVETLIFSNKSINKLFFLLGTIFNSNFNSNKLLKKKLDSFNPDYVYIHNVWFSASLGIFKLLKKEKTPVLLKLHNFRYFCSKSYLIKKHLKGDNFCKACGLEKKSHLFFNKYFNESYLKSLYLVHFGKKFFKIVKSSNFKILVLTNFHKNYLEGLNIQPTRIFILYNFLKTHNPERKKINEKFILYAGRISKEKGVQELITSHADSKLNHITLKIIGDGPNLDNLRERYKNYNVDFLGFLDNETVKRYINNAYFVVTATKLFEGQPTFLCEASALGIPAIFPDSGGISEFFPKNSPLMFRQYDYQDLTKKFNLAENYELLKEIGTSNQIYISELLKENSILEKLELILDE